MSRQVCRMWKNNPPVPFKVIGARVTVVSSRSLMVGGDEDRNKGILV